MRSPLLVAAYQMETGFDVAGNATKIHAAIAAASAEGAGLLAVPECALSGYLPPKDLDFASLEREEARIAAHAADASLWVALGTTRREGGRWLNSARLYSPAGQLAASYDKTHLIDPEPAIFRAGDDLPVFRTGEWTIGLQICFDMRFPENWRILRRKGAEMVIHLSNASRHAPWKVPVLDGTMRARASENGMFVVSVNDAREPQMMVSAILDPDGRDLARAPENRETIVYAELDRAAVKDDYLQARRTDLWSRPENRDLLLG